MENLQQDLLFLNYSWKPKHCFLVLSGHWCLRNVNLRAPEAVRSGESLTVSCTYVLEREKLYSVKFYLGDIEFYRFVPRESPPTRVFRPNGVSIKVTAPFGCYFKLTYT